MVIEGYTLFDAFYMTVITVSTVGFNEVQELTTQGKVFTSFLILASFGTFAYALSSITKYVVGGEYRAYFKDYKMNKEVEKQQSHVIVCGYGRVGTQAVSELKAHDEKYVILEQKQELLEKFREKKEHLFLDGNATSDETLLAAGINNAKALITTLPSDADNLFVVLSARELNPRLQIISRASNYSSVKKLKRAGANNVIMPDSLGGAHMASLVANPDVLEFLDHISIQGQSDCNLEEIKFRNIPSEFKNKSLGELKNSFTTGCSIIGYKNPDGEYIVNPSNEVKILPNSKIFVLGDASQIKDLNKLFRIDA
jgi:voltage-gated potassium channel